MAKSVLFSKVLWFNSLALVYGLVSYYHAGPIPAADPAIVGMIASVINLVLRFKTTQPVAIVAQ